MNKNYYEVLGVEKDAPAAAIKSAYRSLAKKYHPDISKEPNAEAMFKDIAEAYDVLGDAEKRQQYDTYGSYDSSQFYNRYQSGDFYSGVNQADIKFVQFSDLSFKTKFVLISLLILIITIIVLLLRFLLLNIIPIIIIIIVFNILRKYFSRN